jgi:hypothetical protein
VKATRIMSAPRHWAMLREIKAIEAELMSAKGN